MTAERIVEAYTRLGYRIDRGPGEINICYVEGANADFSPNGNKPNHFNDRRVTFRFEQGKPVIIGNWEATSEPGRWYTDNKLNPKGAARVKLGQWKGWRIGIHPRSNPSKGHEALVQDFPITVCRDGNRDYSRAGDFEDNGMHGINQHWGYNNPTTDIKTASAGCLVGREVEGHKAFMAQLKTDPRYQADKKFVFTTTILTVADLNNIPAPTQVPTYTETTMKLTWLASVLRDAGLTVIEQPGWQTRGHGDMGTVRGVMIHHTAGAKGKNAPSLNIVQNGRPDLKGPLSQLLLARDGTYYVVAAGLCSHAGAGAWQGITAGNASFIGIEAENTGLPDDPWPEVQMDAYKRGTAALMMKIRAPIIMCVGHKEYALPKGRKSDPSFDMNRFRSEVAALMGGALPEPTKPTPAGSTKFTNITATVFGGPSDTMAHPTTGAYGLIDWDEPGVALPFRFRGERPTVRVYYDGESVDCDVVDVGPWNIDDDYWSKPNGRPRAETAFKAQTPLPTGPNKGKVPRNDAGIDLTPGAAEALGLQGKGKVDWEFVGEHQPATPRPPQPEPVRPPPTPPVVRPPEVPAKPADGQAVGWFTVVTGIVMAIAAFIQDHAWLIFLGVVAIAAALFAYRIIKGAYPWTGEVSQDLLPPTPQRSEPSLEQLLAAQLALQSVESPVPPLPQPSVLKPRRKPSRQRSKKTRKVRSKSSGSSKRRKVSVSARRRSSKSKGSKATRSNRKPSTKRSGRK